MNLATIPLIPCAMGNYQKGRSKAVQYLVIHYTAGNGDTARANCNYFKSGPERKASAHYFVDEKEVLMSVDPKDTAWHCGGTLQGGADKNYGVKSWHTVCTNSNSIGIEHCSRIDVSGNYCFKDDTIENGIQLVRELMKKYGIPIENVIRHYDVTFKRCPAPLLKAVDWEKYKARLTESEDDEMTQAQFNQMMDEWLKQQNAKAKSKWFEDEFRGKDALVKQITDGTKPQGLATREQVAAMILRAVGQ